MPLIRGRGGLLLREPGGSLTFDLDCCCTPAQECPAQSFSSAAMVVEDLDNAWLGFVDLGPVSLPNVATPPTPADINRFEGLWDYNTCELSYQASIELNCTSVGGVVYWQMNAQVYSGTENPWDGMSGTGMTKTTTNYPNSTTVIFEFDQPVRSFAEGSPCGWPAILSPPFPSFRVTFTLIP